MRGAGLQRGWGWELGRDCGRGWGERLGGARAAALTLVGSGRSWESARAVGLWSLWV